MSRSNAPVGPSRRRLLGGAAGLSVAALAGCTDRPAAATPPLASSPSAATAPATSPATAPATAPATSGPRSVPGTADWAALAAGLAGSVVLPDQAGYGRARQVYNIRFDGIRPAAVVRCANPADVSAALAFRRRFALTVVPRGGGHSYLGASTGTGAMVLDTGPMAEVRYDAASTTATVGAGARLIDVYAGLDRSGVSVPAGSCPSVGIAGQTLGGGQGVAAHAHGLTCDTVTGMQVVTADGRVRQVDARREPDLFWALRGGGGGTSAVVTSFRLTTFGTADCAVWSARWPWTAADAVVAGWQRWVASMPAGDWGNLHLEAAGGEPTLRVSGVSLGGDAAAAVAALTRAVGTDPTSTDDGRHSWLDTMLLEAGCSRTGYQACHLTPAGSLDRERFVAGSSVLGAALPPAGIAALTGLVAARARAGRTAAVIVDPLTGVVSRGSTATSAYPWRGALATVQWYVSLASASGSAARDAAAFVAGARRTLRPWSIGAYVNYPDASVTDPLEYHGATAGRLARVSARYDPEQVFRTPTGVPAG
jgi:FAD/FMN-containing dehydrogenase